MFRSVIAKSLILFLLATLAFWGAILAPSSQSTPISPEGWQTLNQIVGPGSNHQAYYRYADPYGHAVGMTKIYACGWDPYAQVFYITVDIYKGSIHPISSPLALPHSWSYYGTIALASRPGDNVYNGNATVPKIGFMTNCRIQILHNDGYKKNFWADFLDIARDSYP